MPSLAPQSLIPPEFGPAASIINSNGSAEILLVCEHASRFIPPALDQLGLKDAQKTSHVVWDIGAESLSRSLSEILDAPLVISNISRLVYDCNRPPESLDSIPVRSEIIDVPGNRNLSEAQRKARIEEVYRPFRELLASALNSNSNRNPALVTIHSFTPIYFGRKRQVELGLLHDADDRLAKAMFKLAPGHTHLKTQLNEPYGQADGVTHTLKQALPRGLLNLMIEVRNDFLAEDQNTLKIAKELAQMIKLGLEACKKDGNSSGDKSDRLVTGGNGLT
ncbi:MAG: N-formylglutamate amidohydrolase [Rhizobiaceae bacterium]